MMHELLVRVGAPQHQSMSNTLVARGTDLRAVLNRDFSCFRAFGHQHVTGGSFLGGLLWHLRSVNQKQDKLRAVFSLK